MCGSAACLPGTTYEYRTVLVCVLHAPANLCIAIRFLLVVAVNKICELHATFIQSTLLDSIV